MGCASTLGIVVSFARCEELCSELPTQFRMTVTGVWAELAYAGIKKHCCWAGHLGLRAVAAPASDKATFPPAPTKEPSVAAPAHLLNQTETRDGRHDGRLPP